MTVSKKVYLVKITDMLNSPTIRADFNQIQLQDALNALYFD